MQTIYLDISNKGVIPAIYAKQGDVGRRFLAVFTDAGVPYSPPAGSAFSVWYDGDSGDGNYTDIGGESAFSVNANTVSVELITQMLEKDGEGVLCLVLSHADGKQISSWNIPYTCEFVPGFESEEAKSYYTAFSETVENLQKLVETDPTVPAWAKQPQKPAYTAVEVGARPNTWMPTASDVGAAPAGYGLGVSGAVYTSDLNTCIQNGWYYTNSATLNIPHTYFSEASVFVMGRTSTNIVQKLTSISYRSIMMRYTTDGGATWVEEWVDPPMAVGVEYRTAERFDGKPVYAKLVDFGALPNATYKTVSLGTTNGQKIVYCHAVTSTGVTLPYVDTTSTAAGWMMRVKNASASAVTIETTGNYSTLTVCVFVKYTKATD